MNHAPFVYTLCLNTNKLGYGSRVPTKTWHTTEGLKKVAYRLGREGVLRHVRKPPDEGVGCTFMDANAEQQSDNAGDHATDIFLTQAVRRILKAVRRTGATSGGRGGRNSKKGKQKNASAPP